MEQIGLKAVLEDQDFQKGIKKYTSSLDTATKTTEKSATGMSGLSGKFKELTGISLGGATAIGTAGIAIKKLVDFTRESINEFVDYNQQIREMSQVTGLVPEEVSRIIQVADDVGVSAGQVQSALELMNKNGITPSIDNLMVLADEYINTEDKSKFAEEATKKYGRAVMDLVPILVDGGDALRKNTDAVDKGMIATQESIEMTLKYQQGMDNLSDSLTLVKNSLAFEVIPKINKATDAFSAHLIKVNEQYAMVNKLKAAQEKGNITWAELFVMTTMVENGFESVEEAEQWLIDATGDLEAAQAGATAGLVPYSDYTEDLSTAIKENTGYILDNERGLNKLIVQQDLSAEASKEQKLALDEANTAMDILGGALGTLSDDYIAAAETELAFKLALGLVTQEMYDEKIAILDTLTPLQEMSKLVEDGTLDISYLRQAMADGKVTADELEAAYRATGLSAEEARLKVLGLTDAINNMPTRRQIDIDVVYNPGQLPPPPGGAPIPKQGGGPVWQGSPYLVGEQGIEMFVPNTSGVIIPNNALSAAVMAAYSSFTPPSVSYSGGGGGGNSVVINMGGVAINNGADEQMFIARIETAVLRAMGV